MKLIGLNGRLQSGKDTALSIIQDAYPQSRILRVAFADKLKLSAARALGFEPKSVEEAVAICNRLKEEDGQILTQWGTGTHYDEFVCISGRKFLQIYGTEAHREVFGTDFWVNALLPYPILKLDPETRYAVPDHDMSQTALRSTFPNADAVFVTDCRFENEAQRILDLGGSVWKIDADRRLGPLTDIHASEQPLPKELVTVTITNNSTIDQFQAAVLTTLELSGGLNGD